MKFSGNHRRIREREFFICCSSKAQFSDVSMCNGQDLGTTVLSPWDISVQTRSIEKCGQQTAPYSSHFRRAKSDFSRLTCSLYLTENKWNLSQHLEGKKIQQRQKKIIKSRRVLFRHNITQAKSVLRPIQNKVTEVT